ncbi:uncharacterized protein LOC131323833 [Rhododendron vialii]|uniref:uncharacterized protein LOC131323833 n=1 Tax=Rhododendron vialii TaxID=182163 RepID=UPI00265F3E9F|nr:uncharacterized protein LOC131323833 [Rhododendron vialii]
MVMKKKNGKWRVCVDYTNLNDACPKDWFPLPKIDQLLDATVSNAWLSFLDAYRDYHQIAMDPDDMEKSAFITPYGIFLEAYIDNLIVKSQKEYNHLQELAEVFKILKFHKLRLNAEKCAFGMSAGKFLGHLVTRCGIETDPTQIKAVADLRPPRTIREVQRLTGMAVALNWFINKSSDKCHAFFHALKRKSQRSFRVDSGLRQSISQTQRLPELGSTNGETKIIRNPLLVPRGLSSCSQFSTDLSHTITILTEHPLKSLFQKADLSNKVSKWAVELANFDIRFQPRTTIKGQILVDFIAELTPEDTDILNTPTPPQPVDGSSNSNGARTRVVLVSPCGTLHESAISIDFPATNNEAEYVALLACLRSALAMKVDNLAVFCDSQLIVNQVLRDYEARDPRMMKYQETATELNQHFKKFKIEQINREHNAHADAVGWEFYTHLQAKFPEFLPCGQGSQQGSGNDTHLPRLKWKKILMTILSNALRVLLNIRRGPLHLYGMNLKNCLMVLMEKLGPSVFYVGYNMSLVDQEMYHAKMAMTITKHNYPFTFVEHEGIRDIHSFLNPMVKSVSRNTAKADVLKLFERDTVTLKRTLESITSRICLTSDLWSSLTSDGYLALTAHYIDEDWVL